MKYSIHRRGQTARQMNTPQYIDWDLRRKALVSYSEARDYTAGIVRIRSYGWRYDGPTRSVARQVAGTVEGVLRLGWDQAKLCVY